MILMFLVFNIFGFKFVVEFVVIKILFIIKFFIN